MSEIFKIFGDARFKIRSDTLKNWKEKNPVLLSGEPSVVTGLEEAGDGKCPESERVKFGDGVTAWADLPWWKGPAGEKGEDGVGVGEFTEQGGEVFNDYENNRARTAFSSARGNNALAGGMCFLITEISTNTTGCTITIDISSNTPKLVDYIRNNEEVVFSATIGNNYTDFAKLVSATAIYEDEDKSQGSIKLRLDAAPLDYTFTKGKACLWINAAPDLGDIPLGSGQSAEGINTMALAEGAHSEGEDTVAAGKYAHAEGKKTYAGYAAHAQNRETRAVGHCSTAGGQNTEALGMYSDSGGVNTKAIASASRSRGNGSIAGTKAFEIGSIDFTVKAEEAEEEITGAVDIYYVSADGDLLNDGKSEASPVTTVAKAVELANTAGYIAGDTVTVKLMGETVDMGDLPLYKFNLVIESLDEKTVATVGGSRIIANNEGALTVYKNVTVSNTSQWSSIQLAGSSVRFTSDSEIVGNMLTMVLGTGNDGGSSRTVAGQSVEIGCKTPYFISLSNFSYSNKTYSGDVSLTVDNGEANTKIGFNAYYSNKPNEKTVYQKNVNLNFKSMKSVSFSNVENAIIEGALQIINSTAFAITPESEGLADISAPMWIINNYPTAKTVLSFTDTAGKFAVKEGYTVSARNIFGDEVVSADGILDLSDSDGEYTVEVTETETFVGSVVLNSTEGLSAGDIISIKSDANQDFLINAGMITAVDEEVCTLTVEGYPSKINRFLSAGKKYLFVLEKPTVGTAALGDGSNANGIKTRAIGKGSHTDGEGTVALGDYQYVCGTYNANKPNTVFELGCGTSDTSRVNAFEVYKDGSVGIYGAKITRSRLGKLLELID